MELLLRVASCEYVNYMRSRPTGGSLLKITSECLALRVSRRRLVKKRKNEHLFWNLVHDLTTAAEATATNEELSTDEAAKEGALQ